MITQNKKTNAIANDAHLLKHLRAKKLGFSFTVEVNSTTYL